MMNPAHLTHLRVSKGYTRPAFARALGVPMYKLIGWEMGRGKIPYTVQQKAKEASTLVAQLPLV